MKRLGGIILWTALFFLLLLAVDQILLRTPFRSAGIREIRTFYVDFRTRVLSLRDPQGAAAPARPSGQQGAEQQAADKSKEDRSAPAGSPRYVYADAQGNLQFASSLDEIPPRFRKDAKPMKQD